MKKSIFTIFIILVSLLNVNASSLSTSIDCGVNKANVGEIVPCDIYVTPNGFTLIGIQANYKFTNTTYNSFVAANNFEILTSENTESKGLLLRNVTGITSNTKIGTVNIKMPDSGMARIEMNNIIASDSKYNNVVSSTASAQIRVISTDNKLKELSLSDATLTPSFDPSVTSYKSTTTDSTIRINATPNNAYATVSGTGLKTLNYGKNNFTIAVKSETGVTKEYTIEITREDMRDDVNTLKTLSVSNDCVLDPEFSSNVTSYECSVESDITKVTISSSKTSSKSSYVSGFGPREIKLSYGKNTSLIKVKNEQGNVKEYTIVITRKDGRSENNYLKSLILDNGSISFDKETTSYAFVLEYEISKLKIVAEAEDEKATITGTGTKTLKVGVNTFNIVVKSERGTTKTYILKVTRQSKKPPVELGNTYLSKLTIENYDFAFDKNTIEYVVKIEDEQELVLEFEPEDKTSSVIMNGNSLLTNGSVITILVTATDGTTKEYRIKITKDIKEIETPSKPVEVVEKEDLGKLFLGLSAVLAIVIIFIIFIFTIIRRNKGKEI